MLRRGPAPRAREAVSPFPIDLGGGVSLRRLTLEDAEAVFRVVDANRERLTVWMPWIDGTQGVEDQRAWIERVTADPDEHEGVGIFVDERYVGGAGLSVGPFKIAGEIGYWIDAAHEGQGLVTRAVRALVGLGFGEVGLHRITIRAGVDNARSRAIPERLGFTQEGVLRGDGKGSAGHGFHDLVVYGLLEDEWRPSA